MLGMHEDTRMAAPGKLMRYAAYGQDTPGLWAWLHQHDWFRKHLQAPEQFFKAAREDFGWNLLGVLTITKSLSQGYSVPICCYSLL